MANRRMHTGELGSAIEQELTIYSEAVDEGISEVISTHMAELVRRTKETAPVGKRHGQFRKNITADYSELRRRGGGGHRGRTIRATWYVKAPDHRLTHLIVHGHATKDGGRTRANPFLQNAVDATLPGVEKRIEEVIEKGGYTG